MLKGNAKYTLFLENDLFFEVFMESGGKAIIKGNYQECPDKDNKYYLKLKQIKLVSSRLLWALID